MSGANVNLSIEELEAVTDPAWILTKNRVMEKTVALFEGLAPQYEKILANQPGLPALVTAVPAKISKGENYQGLPHVMLDFPRIFTRTDVLAIRSFFWWGHYFSITLQLSGMYRQWLHVDSLKDLNGWYLATGKDPWDHDLDGEHYRALTPMETNLDERDFIKLAKKIPLDQWDHAGIFFLENFETIVGRLITAQAVK